MVNSKRLLETARKWKSFAALEKAKIMWTRSKSFPRADASTTLVADKGHFIVYSVERRRFMVPLTYLNSKLFIELLRMSEEVFGLPHNSPITLPCDASFLENVMCIIQNGDRKDVERAFLNSISKDRCASSSYLSQHHNQQLSLGVF